MTTTIDRGSIAYACGCVNRTDDPSGVMRSEHKCAKHTARQRNPNTLDQAYYEELGTLKNGEPWDSPHVGELVEALGPLPKAPAGGIALEVGCGVSPYVMAIHEAGWIYAGMDLSPWALGWMARQYHASITNKSLWQLETKDWGLILAAHVLEHLPDAPGGIKRCADLLAPGGELWIVVPDDSDPCNPDHLWMFTEATLRGCVERGGLEVIREATRRHVPHERFLYLRARKPV